jgi:hypothetical protein
MWSAIIIIFLEKSKFFDDFFDFPSLPLRKAARLIHTGALIQGVSAIAQPGSDLSVSNSCPDSSHPLLILSCFYLSASSFKASA